MNTLWRLVKKDLLRDSRHPWGLVVFMTIPVVTALIISLVFSPSRDIQETITLHIAMLDRDDDFISNLLRSVSNQGDTGRNLRLHLVDTPEQGIKLLEKRKVSAFVVLPENLTVNLLENRSATLTLYKNPAESILPRIVEEGLQILCVGASGALDLLQPEMKRIRDMIDRDTMPTPQEVALVAADSVERLQAVEPYLFPPLIQFATVKGSAYIQDAHRLSEDPNR